MQSRSFPPVAAADARVLILGSLPGVKSLEAQRYYAHPQNKFWTIMGELLGAAPTLPYEGRLLTLMGHKIALWDVCKAAVRAGSLDSDIREEIPNDFASFFKKHASIERICFNGAKAAAIYQRKVLPALPAHLQQLPRLVLPSTSPAHAGMPLSQKLAHWRKAVALK